MADNKDGIVVWELSRGRQEGGRKRGITRR